MAPIRSFWIRPLAMGLVLVLGVSVTTCRLDKLINPATADRLVVNPTSVDTSAHFGSSRTDTLILQVGSADGAALPWTASKSAVWVALLDSVGTTLDTVRVVIDPPDTLAGTLLRDTIVFVSATTNGTIRVPLSVEMLAPAPELAVTPAADAETLFVGSAVPDTFTLWVKNTGGLSLTWTAWIDPGWITLSDSGSTVAAQDSIGMTATLTANGLAAGTHQGSITVTAPDAVVPQVTVPVTLTVKPCDETPITLDAVVSSSIALRDCGAPMRSGSQAKVYAVQANAGDTLLVRLASGSFDAYLILTNTTGVALLDSSDACGAQTGPACLNFIVSTTARYLIEATTKNPGETGAFTLSAAKGLTPNPPSTVNQFRANGTTPVTLGAVTPESTVVFKATVNDPNPGDTLHLEVEVEGVNTGVQPIHVSGPVPPGTPISITVSGLSDNEPYHWRARTCDQTSRCSSWFNFGGNVDPAADFIVNWNPQNPSMGTLGQAGANGAMAVGGSTGGPRNGNVTVTFTAGVTDFDPGDLISIEVEYKQVGTAFDSTTVRGSGVTSGGTASHAVSVPVPLLLNTSYHWRARVCDQTNRCSAWVSFGGGNPESDADFVVP